MGKYQYRYYQQYKELIKARATQHKKSHPELHKRYNTKYKEKIQMLLKSNLGDKCFFDDSFCEGPLQLDHKEGAKRTIGRYVTKKGIVYSSYSYGDRGGFSSWVKAIKNPNDYMFLCRFHNRVKSNIPYSQLYNVIESMLRKRL